MPKVITTENFIKKSNDRHNFRYDYSNVEYINAKTKVLIICKDHGIFHQTPDSHLRSGCKKCGVEKKSKTQSKNTKWFIQKSTEVHGDVHDYHRVKYTNINDVVEIVCKNHGVFMQSPNAHINAKSGCLLCKGDKISKKLRNTKEDFVENSKKIHGCKYDYSESKYINAHVKVEIICKEHGPFYQSPNNHIRGNGCPKCNVTSGSTSKIENVWLDLNKIENRQVKIFIKEKYFIVDGLDSNVVYEFYGDYWHGNPKNKNPDKLNKTLNRTFGDLYNSTLEREKIIKENGYKIISIWESEFKKYLKNNVNL